MIYERLSDKNNVESTKLATQSHLEEFASQGLRTLCCAVAEISPQAYEVIILPAALLAIIWVDSWNLFYNCASGMASNIPQSQHSHPK